MLKQPSVLRCYHMTEINCIFDVTRRQTRRQHQTRTCKYHTDVHSLECLSLEYLVAVMAEHPLGIYRALRLVITSIVIQCIHGMMAGH